MKRCVASAPFLLAGVVLCSAASAAGPAAVKPARQAALVVPFPAPPAVSSRSFLVQNLATGEVIAGRNERRLQPIASITKLMTALVALERARPGDTIRVSRAAAAVDGSQAGLFEGQLLTVRELVQAALVPSANDAAFALADGLSGGRSALFVRLMNQRARALGMTDTRFRRPEGLDAPGQRSSARDVALLARAAMAVPLIRDAVRLREVRIGGRRLLTRNDLLRTTRGVVGIKTGTTKGAGWSQVAAASRDSVRILVVSLGSPSRAARNRDVGTLLAWGLDRYRTVEAIERGRVYARARLPYGRVPLDLVATAGAWRVVHSDLPLVERIVAPGAVALPVERGLQLGELFVYAGRRLVARSPLVAARSVERPGLGGRASFYGGRTLERLRGWLS